MKMSAPAICLAAILAAAVVACAAAGTIPSSAPSAATAPTIKKPTLAILPFLGADDKETKLAEKMRFAISQKIVNDLGGGGKFDRIDNVKVEEMISALGIPWSAGGPTGAGTMPEEEDVQKVLTTLGADKAIAGIVKGRTLTLMLYDEGKLARSATVDILAGTESPKLAVEKILTDLTGWKFAHIRDLEADHSDPAGERRFAERANLVTDPGFEDAGKENKPTAAGWDAILGPDHYAPPVITAEAAKNLPEDKVAIVPKSAAAAADSAALPGHCLMMRMSKNTAENNGLACVSTWIPVEAGKKYRFACTYKSDGPTARLFLKGFAYKPDQYGDKKDPEATRREYYRAQVAPREKTKRGGAFELIEMDFTPSSLKPTDPKIEWMRVDLYIYLTTGTVYFDDITMKKLDE